MEQSSYVSVIKEQTQRALWEVHNVIDCVPNELWEKEYGNMPCWKHIYHMLHSLDVWFINPSDQNYVEPDIHERDLNNLDVLSDKRLSRKEMDMYFNKTKGKIMDYMEQLTDEQLLAYPKNCEYTKFTLILAQHRHLHSHMGMLMGFIIADTGMWPRVLGLEQPFPEGEYEKYG